LADYEEKEKGHHINEFYVKPEFRGDGNSLAFANLMAEDLGGKIRFSTNDYNVPAMKFWQKFCAGQNCETRATTKGSRIYFEIDKSKPKILDDMGI
jgi:predicted acetyltransferase